ncbi:MAG: hypothetical protein EPO08_05350 [Rhodospirillaceae bacterium]|nr:MAG: hypothetical protein EPO08_05350 [Rhodospirillaceae bacterium]
MALELLKSTRTAGVETTKIDVYHIAVNGDVAFTARADHMRCADGSIIESLPLVVGITLKNGKIVPQADFYDPSGLLAIFSLPSAQNAR